ncbi:MAG: HlyD family secretion protein [Lachnospiraceae bacterium]|nr:HlyD family secretion protein [Lachnospiraceae bacterium]
MPDNKQKKPEACPAPRVINRGSLLLLCAAICIFFAFGYWFFNGTIQVVLNVQGSLHAGHESFDVFENSGTVEIINIQELDYVHEGDLLFVKKDTQYNDETGEESETIKEIYAPVSGFVTDININPHTFIDPTVPAMKIMASEDYHINGAVTLLDGFDITDLDVGDEVKLSVKDVQNSRTLYLDGEVEYISIRPTSRNALARIIGANEVEYFYEEGIDQYLVKVKVNEDELDESNRLFFGQMCGISIITDEKRPYETFFGM